MKFEFQGVIYAYCISVKDNLVFKILRLSLFALKPLRETLDLCLSSLIVHQGIHWTALYLCQHRQHVVCKMMFLNVLHFCVDC